MAEEHQLPTDGGFATVSPPPIVDAPPANGDIPHAPLTSPAMAPTTAQSKPSIFIGNIPLSTSKLVNGDNIAAAFNNSSRKTLCYVAPMIQNDEVIVRPTLEMSREGARRWASTAVGYFLGRKPYFHHLNEFVRSTWPAVMEVTATLHGFYFFRFKTVVAMEEVIEGGPWLFQGQPIILQQRKPGLALRKHKHTQVPVWVRLKHLPVEFWTDAGLSTVASGIGHRYIRILSLEHARGWTSLVYA
ncbi:UNVERIFIED_CONTAM: hypothetical protein Slati_0982700 [Sesamum latifolium]|uniref:DUF4283 domain-containing protein n=1 Tax=Sesamum latifolium TaxID=2727402 RepID=A0AAW2XXG3_9LAMI